MARLPGVGRSVVITGAGSGIGEACALHLDELGFSVFAGVLPGEDVESLRRRASDRLITLPLDVTDAHSIASALEVVTRAVGGAGLAGLVNNAGICVTAPLELVPIAALTEQFEVNVIGQIAVTQAFLPLLRAGGGRVVMMGSVLADVPFPLGGPYVASKTALKTLSTVLRIELSPWDIPVSLVVPGGVATPLFETAARRMEAMVGDMQPEARGLYGLAEDPRPKASDTPKRRLPPQAIASVVASALTARKPRAYYPVGITARFARTALLFPFIDRLIEWWMMRAVRRRGHTLRRA